MSSCSCLCPIHWSQVLSREWRSLTGDAPTTSECSTILLPTEVRLILEVWRYLFNLSLLIFLIPIFRTLVVVSRPTSETLPAVAGQAVSLTWRIHRQIRSYPIYWSIKQTRKWTTRMPPSDSTIVIATCLASTLPNTRYVEFFVCFDFSETWYDGFGDINGLVQDCGIFS